MSPLLIIYLIGALVIFILCVIMYRTNAYKEIFFFDSTIDSIDAFARTMVCVVLYPIILAFCLVGIILFFFIFAINEISHFIFKMPKEEI